MIVNSHYVPLQPPFPIIYSNGEVAMQTGTLIVVEGRDPSSSHPYGNREPPYAIRTHSHPVVSYVNKQIGIVDGADLFNDYTEGVVWNRVELSEVTVIAFMNSGKTEPSIPADMLLDRISEIIVKGRINALFYGKEFYLNKLVYRLELLGLSVPKQTQIRGKVRLILGGTNKPDKKSIIPNNIMNLPAFFFAVEWVNTDNSEVEIMRQIDEYITAFSIKRGVAVNIEFWSKNEELQELAERLTKKYSTKK